DSDPLTSLLCLSTFLEEPDADLGAVCDLFANRVNVLVPRDLLARHDQLSRAGAEQIVAFADGPFHQLRTAVDKIVIIAEPAGAIRSTGVDSFGIVVQHEISNRVMNDSAALQVRRTK